MTHDESIKERLPDDRSRETLNAAKGTKIRGRRDTSARNDRRFGFCHD